jgi:hypothetical protein
MVRYGGKIFDIEDFSGGSGRVGRGGGIRIREMVGRGRDRHNQRYIRIVLDYISKYITRDTYAHIKGLLTPYLP